jgi:hypothetical protein
MKTMLMTVVAAVPLLLLITCTTAFMPHPSFPKHTVSASVLSMVLEKPRVKEIAKLEQLKIDSDYLIHPLKEVG